MKSIFITICIKIKEGRKNFSTNIYESIPNKFNLS